jgi:hypothetical protein
MARAANGKRHLAVMMEEAHFGEAQREDCQVPVLVLVGGCGRGEKPQSMGSAAAKPKITGGLAASRARPRKRSVG